MILLQLLNTTIHYFLLKFLKKTRTLSEIELLIVSWLVSHIPIILLIDLAVWLRWQVNLGLVMVVYAVVIIFGLVAIFINRKRIKEYKWNLNFVGMGLPLMLILVALYANVYSVRFFNAPLLHDPSNHGKVISSLLTDREKFDRSWYPQGFDYLAANYYLLLNNSGIKVDVAKMILWQTNISSALFPVAIYILTSFLFGKFIGLIGFFLFFLNKIPFDLFYSSGKNSALLFETTLFGVIVSLMFLLEIKRDWLVGVITGICFYVLWLIHFPQLLLIGLPLWFLINRKVLNKKTIYFALLVFLILTCLWGLRNYNAYILGNESIKIFSKNMENELFGSYWKEYIGNIYEMVKRYSEPFIMYLTATASLVAFFNFRKHWQVMVVMCYLFLVTLLSVILRNTKLTTLGVFLNEELYMVIALTFVFSIVFFLSKIKFYSTELKIFLSLFFICLIVNRGKFVYWKYYENRVRDVVTTEDLDTMKYFENKGKIRVLINNNNNGKVIAGVDAGMWIPTYYPNVTVLPSDFNHKDDYMANNIWMKLLSEENGVISLLKSNKIDYIYIGANQVFGWSDKAVLDRKTFLKRVCVNVCEVNSGVYEVE